MEKHLRIFDLNEPEKEASCIEGLTSAVRTVTWAEHYILTGSEDKELRYVGCLDREA